MATLKWGKFLLLYPLNPFIHRPTDINRQEKLTWNLCHYLAKDVTVINNSHLQHKYILLDPIQSLGMGFRIGIDRSIIKMWITNRSSHLLPSLPETGNFICYHLHPYLFLPVLVEWGRNKVIVCDGKKTVYWYISVIEQSKWIAASEMRRKKTHEKLVHNE